MLLAAVSCAGLAGCGGGSLGAEVSGVVTLNGEPLTTGDVTYTPIGDGQVAYGKIGAGGSYTLRTGDARGIKPGEYHVTVVATGEPPSDTEPPPLLTPAKYSQTATSGLQKTVNPGKNDIPIVLEGE